MSRATGIFESGVTELIGKDEQVDNGDMSGSVQVSFTGPRDTCTGEIIAVTLISYEAGSGAVLQPTGQLIFFDADPTIASGATDMAAAGADHKLILGHVDVKAADWFADASGAYAHFTTAIPFHRVSSVYASFNYTLATAMNSAAGDDEHLDFNCWIRADTTE